jgi:hypothetical protein
VNMRWMGGGMRWMGGGAKQKCNWALVGDPRRVVVDECHVIELAVLCRGAWARVTYGPI